MISIVTAGVIGLFPDGEDLILSTTCIHKLPKSVDEPGRSMCQGRPCYMPHPILSLLVI